MAAALIACVATAYWPGLYGFWTRDDFMQLAFARLVGSPWPLFVHDHYFPGPGSIFRPLGFASFWLAQALFGTDYFAHAFGDLVLHAGVALALLRVLRGAGLERTAALLVALIFALHPAVLGTALWWSARFDLLAALFAFLALRAAFDYAERRTAAQLAVALGAMLAALLSKETAAAALVAIAFVWTRAAWRDARRAPMLRALALLAATALAFFVWRAQVLGTATSGIGGDASLLALAGKGTLAWFDHLAGYLTFWVRANAVERGAALVAAAAFAALTALARGARWTRSDTDMLVAGLCLFLLPALLQAPIAAQNAHALRGDASAVEAAMQSRLYYLSFGGLAITIAPLIRRVFATDDAARRIGAASLLAVVALALGAISRDAATRFAERTRAGEALARAAVDAVDALDLPQASCHVVLLAVEPPPEWSIYVSMDSVVKALALDLDRVGHCFVHSSYPTYFHLLRGDVEPADATPFVAREAGGRAIPWLHVGDATAAYVDAPAGADPGVMPRTIVLRYGNAAFHRVGLGPPLFR